MSFLNNGPVPAAKTLRVLSRLLSYPDQTLRRHLPQMLAVLQTEGAVSASRLAELAELMNWLGANRAAGDALQIEEAYVELFDRGRATSLHLFEHVHGDSRERGPAMIDLAKTFEQAQLFLAPGEMPDFLPVVLEFASTQPPREARDFLGEIAHILNAILAALTERQTRYASVLAALLELAGERVTAGRTAKPVKIAADEPLDESWQEPVVFDGCSTRGQASPNQLQTIQIVRKPVKDKVPTGAII